MIRFLLSISVFALCVPALAEIVIPLSVYSVTTHRAKTCWCASFNTTSTKPRDRPLSEVEGAASELLLRFAIPPSAIP
jgi:hypothetical protein